MRVVLTAGGTGGHIFPAKSIADILEAHQHTILFITDERGRSYAPLFPSSRILNIRYRSGKIGRIKLLIQLTVETFKMIPILRKMKPHVVVGFGGYPSIPAVLAAQLLRIPTVLHEQNVHLGKANRYLAFGAEHIIGSFPKTPRATFLGNPVRQMFLDVAPYAPSKTFNLLVLGGSLGARIFSDSIPKALKKLPETQQRKIHVTQQCIPEMMPITHEAYKGFEGTYTLSPFFEDIATEMEKATLIVARSGGSTVAEICATGRPSILVPFAASKEGDQHRNANFMKKNGASFVFSEYHFNVDNLYKMLFYLLDHPHYLLEMSKQAYALSRPNAAQDIVELLEKFA